MSLNRVKVTKNAEVVAEVVSIGLFVFIKKQYFILFRAYERQIRITKEVNCNNSILSTIIPTANENFHLKK